MPLWQWIADAAGVIVLVILAYGVALVVRRRLLSRHGGTFELSYRARPAKAGRGWVLGIGRYSGDDLEWFRIFTVWPRPRRTWSREELAYQGRREPVGAEQVSLYNDHVIVILNSKGESIEVAMSPRSLMGFQSWLEGAPPGTDWTRRRPQR